MTAQASIYQRMGMDKLRPLAKQSVENYDDEATRVYVQRLIDMELDRRLTAWDDRPGWPQHSPTATIGEVPGGGGMSDQMLVAVTRGFRDSPWYQHARQALGQLSERNLMALMLQARKGSPRSVGDKWQKGYEVIAAAPGPYLLELGWPGYEPKGHTFDCITEEEGTGVRVRKAHRVAMFKNGQAIKKAAHSGRAELLLLAKAGAI